MGMPPEERLGLDLKRTEQAVMAAKAAALSGSGLSVPQYAALAVLAENPGISGAALARACLVTPQAMAALLKNLQEIGLIERSPHPWHQKMLETRLTAEGQESVRIAETRAVAFERRLAGEFTPAERETLRALLARCVEAATRKP
ncbi:MarR family transcriptional regulator [Kitasatospora sp. NBC_01287]|uniref:MarR family winged helix-turn-helix transcriptional regulator n=1 Tax=Kitasatospora sp. NBC_01287 TaxID=2903573 RepID=UPI00225BEE8E|nr:MarR family transcriptional regulator [Kitasatospora sp. NBC_01287]MCX4744649.1 MarR family transcriptional regulator [Kitasatospora sp. NBC_01287]